MTVGGPARKRKPKASPHPNNPNYEIVQARAAAKRKAPLVQPLTLRQQRALRAEALRG